MFVLGLHIPARNWYVIFFDTIFLTFRARMPSIYIGILRNIQKYVFTCYLTYACIKMSNKNTSSSRLFLLFISLYILPVSDYIWVRWTNSLTSFRFLVTWTFRRPIEIRNWSFFVRIFFESDISSISSSIFIELFFRFHITFWKQ